ncbi:glucoamylase family protein [Cesiribacter andamanensis]|uniref:Glycoamylase-like domain-containing protein n=1 Tax=Cesiribacter andamanensis AMV16 TaxID=1279009 RepID=M7N6V9_9BACT|nr:glucoamylase family protein [Cesiribacter andamanensis]EMR03017.1 hypothetical protein ADICEAN_01866 [Cesiribacter andamanensis AMV16]
MHKLLILSLSLLLLAACQQAGTSSGEVAEQAAADTLALPSLSDDSLFSLVQERTFQYFWKGAEPVSGLARERIHIDGEYPQNDQNVITSGGSGFGLMALVVGMERGFISRQEGIARLQRIVPYLEKADRFHGVWPHWLHGPTGKVKPFSPKDDGGDLVETSFLVAGLLTVRQYLDPQVPDEAALIVGINRLWQGVEWDWYTQGKDVLYWHWSPTNEWAMNFALEGYNECLITYVLAAASPTHPIRPEAYHQGWARGGGGIRSDKEAYGYPLILSHNGAQEMGGPLFWAHYSYLGLDPRQLKDRYANYWDLNRNHTLINRQWCIENPHGYQGYGPNCWGLTASYSIKGYAGHRPGEDLGVISPTAALSSMPYTPEESKAAMRYFYDQLGSRLLGPYGFYDAFSEEHDWFPQRYLAIDQGPIVVMMENQRSGLLWDLFMSAPEVQQGLDKLGFTYR